MTFQKTLDIDSPTKVCPGCGIEKSKETDYWKNKSARDGVGTQCKDCSRKSTKKWRESAIGKAKVRANNEEWRANNPDKLKESKRKYRDNNLESVKQSINKCWEENGEQYRLSHWRYWLKKRYGLTEDRFYELMEEQNYRCAICGSLEKDSRKQKFCVDHCHATGVVRGLLCFGCNTMLGNVRDSIEILESAIEYLKKFPKNSPEPMLSCKEKQNVDQPMDLQNSGAVAVVA